MGRKSNAAGVYSSGGVTLADGDDADFQFNASGYLLTASGGTGTSSNTVQGTAADNAAAVGNPVMVSGKYFSAQQTYANNDTAVLETDVNGILKTVEQYAPGYEDNTNSKAVVEHRYTSSGVMVADTAIKTGGGLVHTITFSCNDAAPTAGSFILYDNTAESGTQIFNHTFTTTPFAPCTVTLDVTFATGLYAGFSTTGDVNVVVSYR